MKLSAKEINYLRRYLADDNIHIEMLLSVLNAKRSPSNQLSAESLLFTIENFPPEKSIKDGSDQDGGVSNSIVEHARPIERLKKIAADDKANKDAIKSVANAGTLVETYGPYIAEMLNPKPKSYTIVSGKTQAVVIEEVVNRLRYGWVPLGGISAAAFGISPVGGNQYIQAMVKY